MKKHKRIILVGPTASGKNYIRQGFVNASYKPDISYTSRTPRENEVDGVDYHFISQKEFQERINDQLFYEWIKYGNNYYGTGRYEWDHSEIFIMETDGAQKIHERDRKSCLIIYVDTPIQSRIKRMKERGWDEEKIKERQVVDEEKFKNFTDFDIKIISQ